jgi:sensor domain CHASE-containing protein
MGADAILPYLVTAVGALLGLLCTILAWVGIQIKAEIRDLGKEMRLTNITLTKIEKDLRGELAGLDRRVSLVEANCSKVVKHFGHSD